MQPETSDEQADLEDAAIKDSAVIQLTKALGMLGTAMDEAAAWKESFEKLEKWRREFKMDLDEVTEDYSAEVLLHLQTRQRAKEALQFLNSMVSGIPMNQAVDAVRAAKTMLEKIGES